MPAASQISVNDATPTAHAFNPVAVSSNLSLYRNGTASTSATEEQIGLSISRANGSRATNKVKFTLSVPHEQTVDGAVIARSTARATVEVVLPDDMTSGERDDFHALLSNMLDNADVKGYITDLEPVW